MITADICY
jgi:hypothetical protein